MVRGSRALADSCAVHLSMSCPSCSTSYGAEMSLVGPRPLVVDEDANVLGHDRSRLHLTPGMTGPWQVFGSRVPMQEMVGVDYLYVAMVSLAGRKDPASHHSPRCTPNESLARNRKSIPAPRVDSAESPSTLRACMETPRARAPHADEGNSAAHGGRSHNGDRSSGDARPRSFVRARYRLNGRVVELAHAAIHT
jgi:hypothetical protein